MKVLVLNESEKFLVQQKTFTIYIFAYSVICILIAEIPYLYLNSEIFILSNFNVTCLRYK